MTQKNIYLGYTAGAIAVFLWACFPMFIKQGLAGTSIISFLFLRYLLATLSLFFVAKGAFKKIKNVCPKKWVAFLTMAMVHNGTQIWCLKQIPVIWYILFFSCSPILTLFTLPQKISIKSYALFVIALIGTGIFLIPEGMVEYPDKLYILLLFICVFSWVFLLRLMMDMHKVYNDLEISFLSNLANLTSGFVLVCGTGFCVQFDWRDATFPLLLIGFLSPIANFLFSYSLRMTPQFSIAAQYLELIFGSLIGYLIFQEIPTPYQWLGGSLIVLALITTVAPLTKAKKFLLKVLRLHLLD